MGDINLKAALGGQIVLTPTNTASNYTATFPAITGVVAVQAAASYTAGSVLFANSSGQIAQDNTNFFWDNTNKRLGIGTAASPQGKLNVGGGRSYFGANSEVYSIGVGYTQTRVNSGQLYYIGATDSTTPSLVFSNAAGTTNLTLDDSGNLGIGTAPLARLHAQNTACALYIGYGANQDNYIQTNGKTYFTNFGATSTWMTLDSSGNVGINTSSPGSFGKLAVQVAGTTTPTNAANVGPSSINLFAAANGSTTGCTSGVFCWNESSPGIGSGIGFSREDGTNWGTQIRFYTHPTATTNISNITECARITAAGNLQFISADAGIVFNKTGALTNSTLNDYEVGTFTPTLTYATPGTLTSTYVNRYGRYIKVGSVVYIEVFVQFSAFSKGTASGRLQITGLPFVCGSPNEVSMSWSVYDTPLTTTAGVFPTVNVQGAGTTMGLYEVSSNNTSLNNWPDPDGNSQYKISGCYQATS